VSTKRTASATSSALIIPRSSSNFRSSAASHSEVGGDAAGADVGAADAVLAQLVVEGACEANFEAQ
jgi:hypothetical protein